MAFDEGIGGEDHLGNEVEHVEYKDGDMEMRVIGRVERLSKQIVKCEAI